MKLLFINTKKNWGGIANLTSILMQTLAKQGVHSYNAVSYNRINSFLLPSPITNIRFRFGFNYNPMAILRLVRLIKQEEINYVVVNITKEIIFGGIAARICGIKCIRLVGNELDFQRHHFLNSNLVDVNIYPSNYTVNESIRNFPYTLNLNNKVIYCGTDDREVSESEKQAEYQRLDVSPTNLIIGCTGRIVADKGVQTLLQAFKIVHAKIPNAVLVINGKGEYSDELLRQARELGIDKYLRLLGFAPDCLIAASIYDIAVMPSRLEGFPNTIIEYLSLGKAVITTPVGGITEAIENNVNGLLFPVDNAAELAEKILQLATDTELRHSLETSARLSYEKRFTAEIMAEAFLALLNSIK